MTSSGSCGNDSMNLLFDLTYSWRPMMGDLTPDLQALTLGNPKLNESRRLTH